MNYKEKTLEIIYAQIEELEKDFKKQDDIQLRLRISDRIESLARDILMEADY